VLVICFVFGISGALGGLVFGALFSGGEEAMAHTRRVPHVDHLEQPDDLVGEADRRDAP
jgi:hypothetical protein